MNITPENISFIGALIGILISILSVVGAYWKLRNSIDSNSMRINNLQSELLATSQLFTELNKEIKIELKYYTQAHSTIQQDISSIKATLDIILKNINK